MMRPKVFHGTNSITCANSVLPTFMRYPGSFRPASIANRRPEVQIVDTHEPLKARAGIGLPAYRPRFNRTAVGPNIDSNWAGAVLTTGVWAQVLGSWQVPTITKPTEPAVVDEGFTGWEMSTWVGLGGYLPNGSNNLLQVGVTQQLVKSGGWGCFPWYEWWVEGASAGPGVPSYTYQARTILNFTVNPGHSITCAVGYHLDQNGQPVGGQVWIGNETTGKTHSPIVLPVPSGAHFSGGSAEWIVEAPDGGEWGTSGEPAS